MPSKKPAQPKSAQGVLGYLKKAGFAPLASAEGFRTGEGISVAASKVEGYLCCVSFTSPKWQQGTDGQPALEVLDRIEMNLEKVGFAVCRGSDRAPNHPMYDNNVWVKVQ
jgi:hypothetical protein